MKRQDHWLPVMFDRKHSESELADKPRNIPMKGFKASYTYVLAWKGTTSIRKAGMTVYKSGNGQSVVLVVLTLHQNIHWDFILRNNKDHVWYHN